MRSKSDVMGSLGGLDFWDESLCLGWSASSLVSRSSSEERIISSLTMVEMPF